MAPVFSTLKCDQQHRDALSKWQAQQNLFPAIAFYPKFKKVNREFLQVSVPAQFFCEKKGHAEIIRKESISLQDQLLVVFMLWS